jgi:hypothetical protein
VIEDPFHSVDVSVAGSLETFQAGLLPFRDVIASGVKAIMTGPIPTDVIDRGQRRERQPMGSARARAG